MTFRAIILGLLLGLGISALTYFNDNVIGQTMMIGNHLPPSVFGVALVVLLVVNPALRVFGRRMPLAAGEMAVICAMGLAVCAWPASGLLRYFTHLMARPSHELQVHANWQASNAFSYVPGGSRLLAEGFVTDWPAFSRALYVPDRRDPSPSVERLWNELDRPTQLLLREAAMGGLQPRFRRNIVSGINAVLVRDKLYDAQAFEGTELPDAAEKLIALRRTRPLDQREIETLSRLLLGAMLPGLVKPAPPGSGVFLLDGRSDPRVSVPLNTGGVAPEHWSVVDLPWGAWWPTIRLWLGLVALIGLATLCLQLIVHPQWSKNEVLTYPTVRFFREVTARREGAWLPDISRSNVFWIGFAVVAGIHLVNGLHAWFPNVPEVVRQLNFDAMRKMFPLISQAPGSNRLFQPTLFAAVIGFGYFINARVAASLGLSLVFWVLLSAGLATFGIPLATGRFNIGANGTALRFGAYIGMTAMILYLGRSYYLRVLAGSIGLGAGRNVPRYAVWATRALVGASGASVWLLSRYAGLSPLLGVLLVGVMLMMLLVLARINCETGLFYAQPDWLPGVMIVGFFGVQGIGPEGLLIMTMASVILAADPREALSPYLANALQMADDVGKAKPGRFSWPLAVMVVAGLAVAFSVTLQFQYNLGMTGDGWSRSLPVGVINQVSSTVTKLAADGELAAATGMHGLDHFRNARPDTTYITITIIGILLVSICAWARLRLPWWPIHPVLFLVWGTYPANYFAVSFLLSALIKTAVVRLGGEQAYHKVKPLMVGAIAGELMMIIVWSIVGSIVYGVSGQTPTSYRIWPT